jgi:uncharacterized protein (DUF58 family)
MENSRRYLNPEVLSGISRLELRARLAVEGFLSGRHPSPYHGVSVEFAEHREYVPGDDLRHLDWKVLAKSDKYFVKRYEEETSLTCHIVVDASRSMEYSGDGRMTKFGYAATAAASLAYLVLRQQDFAGLSVFDESVRTFLPASNNPAHLMNFVGALAAETAAEKTGIGAVLADVASRVGRRGMVVLISDLLAEPEEILRGLGRLRTKKQDIIVFHVLDDDEVNFPFQKLYRFEGMEDLLKLTMDPRALRASYLEVFNEHASRLRKGCRSQGVDYTLLRTGQNLGVLLTAFLATRATSAVGRRSARARGPGGSKQTGGRG